MTIFWFFCLMAFLIMAFGGDRRTQAQKEAADYRRMCSDRARGIQQVRVIR